MKYAPILLACLLLVGCSSSQTVTDSHKSEPGFVHIVFFYLNPDANVFQKQQLMDDCYSYLGSVKTVRNIRVGTPAGTPRDVVDNSYGVCLEVYFDDKEGQDFYQTAEAHLQFIERNKNTWSRVQVYDMIPR